MAEGKTNHLGLAEHMQAVGTLTRTPDQTNNKPYFKIDRFADFTHHISPVCPLKVRFLGPKANQATGRTGFS
jgi:hypothetical protein